MNRNKQSLIFAHRGANKKAEENTRAAFHKALGYAIDDIEMNVQSAYNEVSTRLFV